MNHTPGPWKLEGAEYPDAGGFIPPMVFSEADPDSPQIICTMSVRDGSTESANGALVAAAPEMLEALKLALSLGSIGYHIGEADMRGHDKIGERYGKKQDEIEAKIRAAIARAQGQP